MPPDPAEIAQTHASWLRTVIASRVRERACIDDLMQEIFLAVVRQKNELGQIERIEPWLYRIAIRSVLQHRRRQGRYRKRLEVYWQQQATTQIDVPEDPLAWVIQEEAASQLSHAIERLRPADREVLLLKHSHGWTYREIAEHLGVSSSTVEYRLSRARARLRQLMISIASKEVSQ